MSYEALGTSARAVFTAAADHPGSEFTLAPIACGLQTPVTAVGEAVDELIAQGLVTETGEGRYRLTDVLRGHSREPVDQDDDTRHACTLNMIRWYLQHTAAVALAIDPRERQVSPIHLWADDVKLPCPAAAMAWFAVEHPNVMAAQQQLVDLDLHQMACDMADVLWTPLRTGLAAGDLITSQQVGADAAHLAGDRIREALFLSRVGFCLSGRGEHAAAVTACGRALLLASEASGGKWLDTVVLDTRARAELMAAAVRDGRRALDFALYSGEEVLIARAHLRVGEARYALGEFERAREHLRYAIRGFAELGDTAGQARALVTLGAVVRASGDRDQAAEIAAAAEALLSECMAVDPIPDEATAADNP